MYHRSHTLRLAGLLLLTATGSAVAQTQGSDKLVHDNAHVLRAATVQQLEQRLERYADSTGVQLAVVTVASLHGQEVSQVGDSIKNAWGVGSKETRKGLLYLVAPQEHRQTIRTGRGLEADLPDGLCFRILKETEPGMGQNMELAIVNRVTAIQQQLARAAQAEADRGTPTVAAAPVEEDSMPEGLVGVLLLIAGVGVCWAARASEKTSKAPSYPSNPFPRSVSPGRTTQRGTDTSGNDGSDTLLMGGLLAAAEDEDKKKKGDSDSWSGWGSSSSSTDSSSSDSFSFGGDSDSGGGGGSDSW